MLDILKNSYYNTSHQRPKGIGGLENVLAGHSGEIRWSLGLGKVGVVLETAHKAESLKRDTLSEGWIRQNLFLKDKL